MEDHEESDELKLGSKTWHRIVESAGKTGYREGIDEGSQEVLQSDFNTGYDDGFRLAFILGKYKALARHLLNSSKNPSEIKAILEATRRGECYICKLEASDDLNKLKSSKVIEDHREHVLSTVKKLNQHFAPLLEEKNINAEGLNLENFD